MSDAKKNGKSKKEAKVKKEVRKRIEPTAENVKRVIEECRVADVSLPAIRKLFGATWAESCKLRHEAVKQLKKS